MRPNNNAIPLDPKNAFSSLDLRVDLETCVGVEIIQLNEVEANN